MKEEAAAAKRKMKEEKKKMMRKMMVEIKGGIQKTKTGKIASKKYNCYHKK